MTEQEIADMRMAAQLQEKYVQQAQRQQSQQQQRQSRSSQNRARQQEQLRLEQERALAQYANHRPGGQGVLINEQR